MIYELINQLNFISRLRVQIQRRKRWHTLGVVKIVVLLLYLLFTTVKYPFWARVSIICFTEKLKY